MKRDDRSDERGLADAVAGLTERSDGAGELLLAELAENDEVSETCSMLLEMLLCANGPWPVDGRRPSEVRNGEGDDERLVVDGVGTRNDSRFDWSTCRSLFMAVIGSCAREADR